MKTSGKNSDKRKRKNSFKIFAEDKFESPPEEIQNMFESLRFIEMLEEIRRNEYRANNWFGYNFITKTSSSTEPTSRKSDSYPSKIIQPTDKELNDDTSSFDIIKDDNEVAVTINMPDAKEEEINFKMTKDTIELMPNTPEAENHRFITLPCNVKSKTATYTYKNGVLDIIITRAKGKVRKEY